MNFLSKIVIITGESCQSDLSLAQTAVKLWLINTLIDKRERIIMQMRKKD